MKVELHNEMTVRELAEGFIDNQEEGVFGFSAPPVQPCSRAAASECVRSPLSG